MNVVVVLSSWFPCYPMLHLWQPSCENQSALSLDFLLQHNATAPADFASGYERLTVTFSLKF